MGGFVAGRTLAAAGRRDAGGRARRAGARSCYLYWGELDKVGHVHGCDSWQWGDELEAIDRELARLAASLPDDCSLTITADHGMVDVPHEVRVDVADEPELAAGVRHVDRRGPAPAALRRAGRRATTCTPRGPSGCGDRALVRTREEAVAAGWFGRGAAREPRRASATSSSRRAAATPSSTRAGPGPSCSRCVGLHGSLSDDEVAVPVVHVPPAAVA